MNDPATTEPDDDDVRRAADERMLEVLLRQALEPDPAGREARVRRVVGELSIGRETTAKQDSDSSPGVPARQPETRRRRRLSWLVAAIVVFGAAGIWQTVSPSRRANATVEESLRLAQLPGPREYRVTTTLESSPADRRQVVTTLYVDGADRFALRHPALFDHADIWVGGNDRRVWIVPPHGPVLVGDGSMLAGWTKERDGWTTPYLHVTTILERMSRGYELETLPDESLDDVLDPGRRSLCRRVRGVRREPRTKPLPDTIELWADAETGIARRIVLKWKPAAEEGRRPMTIEVELAGQPQLPEDWFEHDAHHEGRPVVSPPG